MVQQSPVSDELLQCLHSIVQESFWGSDADEKTIIDRAKSEMPKKMEQSTTSTMTSSCTTYGSTDTDGESAVYVITDEMGSF